MKSIFTSNKKEKDSKVFGFVALSEEQMLKVRGGGRPPVARPKDEFDEGDI